MLWLNALGGLGLELTVILGLLVWWKLYRARWRMGRRHPFWPGGGTARVIHRGLGPVMAIPLLVVATSGTLLSIDSLCMGIYRVMHPDRLAFGIVPEGMIKDYSRPLTSADYYTEDRFGILTMPEDVVTWQAWHPGYVDYSVYRLGERVARPGATVCGGPHAGFSGDA